MIHTPYSVLTLTNRLVFTTTYLVIVCLSSVSEFATLSGARVVRIATHPDVQKMGYGSRALDLLIDYFQGSGGHNGPGSLAVGQFGGEGAVGVPTLRSTSSSSSSAGQKGASAASDLELNLTEDEVKPRAKLPPLLTPVSDRPAETLHWLGNTPHTHSMLIHFWICSLLTHLLATSHYPCINHPRRVLRPGAAAA